MFSTSTFLLKILKNKEFATAGVCLRAATVRATALARVIAGRT